MDLRLRDTPPRAEEQAAVDAVLGPPESRGCDGRHALRRRGVVRSCVLSDTCCYPPYTLCRIGWGGSVLTHSTTFASV